MNQCHLQRIVHHTSLVFKSSPKDRFLHVASFKPRFLSSDSKSSHRNPGDSPSGQNPPKAEFEVEDVSTADLRAMVDKYLDGEEQLLPTITDSILRRNVRGDHAESDAELMHEIESRPIKFDPKAIMEDFEATHKTDEETDYLGNIRDFLWKRVSKKKFLNINQRTLDEYRKKQYKKDDNPMECSHFLEDMTFAENLPEEIKKAAAEKFEEVGDMVEKGEISEDKGFEMYTEFRNKLADDYLKSQEEKGEPVKLDEAEKLWKYTDNPPGEGPILRWETRLVINVGNNSFHPKNRRVKMAVTVKELGLSKYEHRRLVALVQRRYHAPSDELVITSDRFDFREENKKDCYRILVALVAEARKATKFVEEARMAYIMERLHGDPAFLEKLRVKAARMLESSKPVP